MSIFTVMETFFGPSELHVTGITDLQIVWVDDNGVLSDPGVGEQRLISTGIQDGGLMSMALTGDGLQLSDSITSLPGDYALSGPMRVEILDLDGTPFVVSFGAQGDALSGYRMDSVGAFVDPVTYTADNSLGAVAALEVITHPNGDTLMFTSDVQGSGLSCWHVGNDGALYYIGTMPTPSGPMTTMPSLAQAHIDGQPYLLSLSAVDNSLTTYAVNPDGSLSMAAELGAANGLGIAAPQAVEVVELNGQTYALVAAGGSSSISVIAIAPDGSLGMVDHVIDDLNTRFASLSTFEVITSHDRIMVLAGGGDDGLSLLTLLPNGRLLHLESFADTNDTNLTNVQAITAYQNGGQIEIFAAGGGDIGITHLQAQTGRFDDTTYGTDQDDTLTGTWRSDLLVGGDGDDTLDGGMGADILMDGAGSDTLTGGWGADVFVFTKDGVRDVITDFDAGEDRIDLSDFGRFYTLAGMGVVITSNGAILTIDGEELQIITEWGNPLDLHSLPMENLFNLGHINVGLIDPDTTVFGSQGHDTLTGGTGDDHLIGGGGNDILIGSDGDDFLKGDGGSDTLEGGGGADDLYGGDGVDRLMGGAGNDRLYSGSGVDFLYGGTGDDTLEGGSWGDSLYGGTGADDLYGGDGFDLLMGGDGADHLWGGTGRDVLWGEGGNDTFDGGFWADTLYGGTGDDSLFGNWGEDRIFGDEGQDVVNGGGGHDFLYGGEGNDTVLGDMGRDTLRGDEGDDFIDAGSWSDVAYGGSGDDTVLGGGGYDDLYGDSGNDSIFGDSGRDQLYGGDGNDQLDGGTWSDQLWGGDGEDHMFGDAGDDVMYGETGNDTLEGGNGADHMFGGVGQDVFYGGVGRDRIEGGTGNDVIYGGDWADLIFGGDGNDIMYGDRGEDGLSGGLGNDILYGGDSRDLVLGGGGDDILFGGTWADVLVGGFGNDTLDGGAGPDTLTGGGGEDVFVFIEGHDRITDFDANADQIHFAAQLWNGTLPDYDRLEQSAQQVGNDMVISFNATTSLTLEGFSDLTALSMMIDLV